MPVGERAAAGNDLAAGVLADGLELSRAANQLEVADKLALARKHAEHLVVDALQAQLFHGRGSGFQGMARFHRAAYQMQVAPASSSRPDGP